MKKEKFYSKKITYEPEADVLSWEMTDEPIDYAREIGNFVVHFTVDNNPVLVEILEAKKFLRTTQRLLQGSLVARTGAV